MFGGSEDFIMVFGSKAAAQLRATNMRRWPTPRCVVCCERMLELRDSQFRQVSSH